MSYIQNNLLPDEVVVFQTKLNWSIYLRGIGIIFIGLFIFMPWSNVAGTLIAVFGIITLVINFLRTRTSEFVVTNKRVLMKVGILRTSSLEFVLRQIEGIGVEQGVFGRMTDSGTIIVRGIGGTRRPFTNIDQPYKFSSFVNQQISGRSAG